MTLDDIRMFTSGLTLNEDEHDAIVTHLLETTSKALLIRCNESIKVNLFVSHSTFSFSYHTKLETSKEVQAFQKKAMISTTSHESILILF